MPVNARNEHPLKIILDENIPYIDGRIPDAVTVPLPASEIDRKTVFDSDALIIRTRTRCDSALLEESNVKCIATATIGTDHIDIPWCERHGITVRNAPGCNAPGVALYVWSCLQRCGIDISSSTVGVVGCGNVGSIVAQWGRRLGANILVCDPPRQRQGFDDFEYHTLEEVLAASDAVTLHTPLTRNGDCPTFHMINRESLGYLKKGAVFVNAARGEVAETESLCEAISEGRVSKAIIDTWENEPAIDRRLLALADVATCHIAGYSAEGKQRATRMALEAIGETLGIGVDTAGLQGPYQEPQKLTPELILRHFDPSALSNALKASEGTAFETLRNSYPLHREIL